MASPLRYALLAIALIGCGGGGGEGSNTGGAAKGAAPQVLIKWPERTRNVSAIGGALSAGVVFLRGTNEDGAHSLIVDRRTSPGSYSEYATAPYSLPPGSYEVQVSFFSDRGTKGTRLGTAKFIGKLDSSGRFLNADGSPLPAVTTDSEVKRLLFEYPSRGIGPVQMIAVAETESGDRVALSDGSATFRALEPFRGTLTREGLIDFDEFYARANVEVTVGSLRNSYTFSVEPQAELRQVAYLPSEALSGSEATGKLYAATPDNAGSRSFSLVEVDPNSGALGRHAVLGFRGSEIQVTPGGEFAYVLASTGKVAARVDLRTMELDGVFDVRIPGTSGSAYVSQMIANPFDPLSVAFVTGLNDLPLVTVHRRGETPKARRLPKSFVAGWIDARFLHVGEIGMSAPRMASRIDTQAMPMTIEEQGPVPYGRFGARPMGSRLIEPGSPVRIWDMATLQLVASVRDTSASQIYPTADPNEFAVLPFNLITVVSAQDGRVLRRGRWVSYNNRWFVISDRDVAYGGISIYDTFLEGL